MNDEVRLRDKRKPGHCWQDNELYDAFAPIVGGDAVLVYVQMTRHCYGTEIRSSLRELAEACGKSKDTVQRAVKVMERVGMVRATAGGSRRVGEWQLVDLKELAIAYGASYDARRASHVLPAAKEAELKTAARQTLAELQRKGASVAQSDRLLEPKVSPGATDLSLQKDTSVAPEGHATSYSLQDTKQQDIPPPTPSTEGVCAVSISIEQELRQRIAELRPKALREPRSEAAQELFTLRKRLHDLREARERAEATDQAARELGELLGIAPAEAKQASLDKLALCVEWGCGFVDGRQLPLLRLVLERQKPESYATTAVAMVRAWREYQRAGPVLRYSWGPKKFFGEGHWRKPESWPVDEEKRQRVSAARVGA